MALPIRDFVASQAVEGVMQKARTLRDNVQRWKIAVDAGTTGDIIVNAAQGMKQARDVLYSYGQVSGLDEAARSEYNDQNLTLTTEISSVVAACDNCLSWINANYPKDGNGYLLDRKIVNGVVEFRSFTAGSLSGLSTQLAALLAAFS